MEDDFVAGTNWGFQLDGVPEGDYEVTVTIGDGLSSASGTNATVTLEGVAQTRLTNSASGHHRHGDVPARPSPTASSPSASPARDSARTSTASWSRPSSPTPRPDSPRRASRGTASTSPGPPSTAPRSYRVERADVVNDVTGEFAQIAETTEPAYTDASVAAGGSYAYRRGAVDAYGRASAPSAEVRSGVIPELVAPAAPADLAVAQVTQRRRRADLDGGRPTPTTTSSSAPARTASSPAARPSRRLDTRTPPTPRSSGPTGSPHATRPARRRPRTA